MKKKKVYKRVCAQVRETYSAVYECRRQLNAAMAALAGLLPVVVAGLVVPRARAGSFC